jgi:hypothetical protein
MADDKIFGSKLSSKNDYYNRAIPYCDTNKVRLMIDATKIADQVTNLGLWNIAYPKSIDKNLTTKTLRDERDGLIPVIENGMRGIYDDIPQSKLTDADRNTLKLKKRDTVKTSRPKITDVPVVKVRGMEGALMEITARTATDSSRPSMHKDADAIEIIYVISDAAPKNINDYTKSFISSKAKFPIQLDLTDAGKTMYCYARWKNNSDNAKSSPWSDAKGMING